MLNMGLIFRRLVVNTFWKLGPSKMTQSWALQKNEGPKFANWFGERAPYFAWNEQTKNQQSLKTDVLSLFIMQSTFDLVP